MKQGARMKYIYVLYVNMMGCTKNLIMRMELDQMKFALDVGFNLDVMIFQKENYK